MAEPAQAPTPEVDWIKKLQDDNIQMALNYLRQLKVHLVLFVPGTTIPEGAKALIYTQLTEMAKLYEPGVAKL